MCLKSYEIENLRHPVFVSDFHWCLFTKIGKFFWVLNKRRILNSSFINVVVIALLVSVVDQIFNANTNILVNNIFRRVRCSINVSIRIQIECVRFIRVCLKNSCARIRVLNDHIFLLVLLARVNFNIIWLWKWKESNVWIVVCNFCLFSYLPNGWFDLIELKQYLASWDDFLAGWAIDNDGIRWKFIKHDIIFGPMNKEKLKVNIW